MFFFFCELSLFSGNKEGCRMPLARPGRHLRHQGKNVLKIDIFNLEKWALAGPRYMIIRVDTSYEERLPVYVPDITIHSASAETTSGKWTGTPAFWTSMDSDRFKVRVLFLNWAKVSLEYHDKRHCRLRSLRARAEVSESTGTQYRDTQQCQLSANVSPQFLTTDAQRYTIYLLHNTLLITVQ